MYSSQNINNDLISSIYLSDRTIFRLIDIAMLTGISNFTSLNKSLNYYVGKGLIQNPRKGIYAKPRYNKEELACSIFSPSYISLEYVLQKAGVIFQYDSRITMVSYLSRNIIVENQVYSFRKIKSDILLNPQGIINNENINIACPERAFLDLFYLDKDYYFDNIDVLNKDKIYALLPAYESKALTERVKKLIKYD